jgi:hypothetical protein
MPIRDRNIAADAAVNPSKMGWVEGDRVFFDDFDRGIDGVTVASQGGWEALATSGAATRTATFEHNDGYGCVKIIAGALSRVDLYTASKWSTTKGVRLKVKLSGHYTAVGSTDRVGLANGTDVAGHEAICILADATHGQAYWRLRVGDTYYATTAPIPTAPGGGNSAAVIELTVSGSVATLSVGGCPPVSAPLPASHQIGTLAGLLSSTVHTVLFDSISIAQER